MTVQEIIQESIKNIKLNIAKDRRRDIQRTLDYYTGNETDKYISKRFRSEALQEVPPYKANITRRLVNKLSRIYTIGAKRSVDTDTYLGLTSFKATAMKHVERMTRLIGSVATRLKWNEGGWYEYEVIPYYHPLFDDDVFNPTAIIYPTLLAVDEISNADNLKWIYWDNMQYAEYDANGKTLSSGSHPYGKIPFVFTHRENQINSHFVEGASDIIDCNEQVNIQLTELALGLRMQAFGQAWITGFDPDEEIMRVGTESVIPLPEDGRFGIESPKGDISAFIEAIKFQIELVAKNNHLWVHWAEQGGEMPSGISLMIKDLERTEDYLDDIDLWRLYEHEFYEVEYAIGSAMGFAMTNPSKFRVDFEEPEYPQTIQDQIMKDEYLLKHNLITEAKIMIRDNKDITLEEARKTINENKKENQKSVASQSIFTKLRNEAQTNGQAGGFQPTES